MGRGVIIGVERTKRDELVCVLINGHFSIATNNIPVPAVPVLAIGIPPIIAGDSGREYGDPARPAIRADVPALRI